jgi:hypothetical protein
LFVRKEFDRFPNERCRRGLADELVPLLGQFEPLGDVERRLRESSVSDIPLEIPGSEVQEDRSGVPVKIVRRVDMDLKQQPKSVVELLGGERGSLVVGDQI